MRISSQFIRFFLVGVINTMIGYLIICICMYLLELEPKVSNSIGYVLSFYISYILHRNLTFTSQKNKCVEIPRYLMVFVFSYLMNLLVLSFLVDNFRINNALSQMLAMATYVITSYLLNKIYTFKIVK